MKISGTLPHSNFPIQIWKFGIVLFLWILYGLSAINGICFIEYLLTLIFCRVWDMSRMGQKKFLIFSKDLDKKNLDVVIYLLSLHLAHQLITYIKNKCYIKIESYWYLYCRVWDKFEKQNEKYWFEAPRYDHRLLVYENWCIPESTWW